MHTRHSPPSMTKTNNKDEKTITQPTNLCTKVEMAFRAVCVYVHALRGVG